jgi:hypothetical protein
VDPQDLGANWDQDSGASWEELFARPRIWGFYSDLDPTETLLDSTGTVVAIQYLGNQHRLPRPVKCVRTSLLREVVHLRRHSVHFRGHSVHFREHSVHFREHSVHFGEHSVHFREFSVHFRKHSAHFREHFGVLNTRKQAANNMKTPQNCVYTPAVYAVPSAMGLHVHITHRATQQGPPDVTKDPTRKKGL